MIHTQNLHLPQWEKTDRLMMDDFNDAFQKLDAAVAACGNCQIEVQTYTGTGTYGDASPCRLTFSKEPALVIISDGQGYFFLMHPNCSYARRESMLIFVTWNGRSVSWYSNGDSTNQFNYSGTRYTVFAFYA